MSTITAVLDAEPDGTVHLPLPPALHGLRVRVEATLQADQTPAAGPGRLRATLQELRQRNPFRQLADPVAWQREVREDVRLPGRG